MNTPKTPTPRTEEARIDNADLSDEGYGKSEYVHADFARGLERELAVKDRESKLAALSYGVYVCDAKNYAPKVVAYRAACDEIKLSLQAAMERVMMGEQMESVAYVTSPESQQPTTDQIIERLTV